MQTSVASAPAAYLNVQVKLQALLKHKLKDYNGQNQKETRDREHRIMHKIFLVGCSNIKSSLVIEA